MCRKNEEEEAALARACVIESVGISAPILQMWKDVDRLPTFLSGASLLFCKKKNNNKACDVDGWPQVSVGVLTVIDEEEPLIPNKLYLDPVSTAIIVEGDIVLDNLQNLPQAICVLFGLSYALNLNYPKGMINTFNFIQKVMLGLGQNKLPPKLQSLKNLLLS